MKIWQAGIRSLLVSAIIVISSTTIAGAQDKAGSLSSPHEQPRQFVVLLKRGPNWIPGKSVSEQPLQKHGRYLKELMAKGSLQFAGPFLDDSGGLILLNAKDASEARQIAEHDPAVVGGILEPEIRPFRIMFDAATGKSPFK